MTRTNNPAPAAPVSLPVRPGRRFVIESQRGAKKVSPSVLLQPDELT